MTKTFTLDMIRNDVTRTERIDHPLFGAACCIAKQRYPEKMRNPMYLAYVRFILEQTDPELKTKLEEIQARLDKTS